MRRTLRVLSLVLLAGALAAPAQAGTGASKASEERALESARNELAARASMTKGAPQQSYDLERRRVDDLISALKGGQSVSPADVYRALEKAHQLP